MHRTKPKKMAQAERGLVRCLTEDRSHLREFLLQLALRDLSTENLFDLVNMRLQETILSYRVYADYTPLGYAIVQNDPQAVDCLLRHGACVQTIPCKPKDKNVCLLSPLHLALKHLCQPTIVDSLLKKGASTKNVQSRDVSCLLEFISKCSSNVTSEALLSDMSCLNRVDNDKRTLLHLAAINGKLSIVIRVLTSHQVDIDQMDATGKTALLYAAQRNSPNIVQLLINYGATVDLLDGWGRTALHFAVRKADLETVELLVSAGANIFTEDLKGLSPLSYAFSNDNILRSRKPREPAENLVVCLLREPGEVDESFNTRDYVQMVFLLTKICQTDEVVINLLEHDKSLSSQRDANGRMLIHVAAEFRKHGVVKWLIEKGGVDSNVTDGVGFQPLHYAAKEGNRQTLFYLLQQDGADVDTATASGWTPVWILIRNGWMDLACDVVRYGCDVTQTMPLSALQQADGNNSLRVFLFDTDMQRVKPMTCHRADTRRISLLRFATKCRFTKLARLLIDVQRRSRPHTRHVQFTGVGKYKSVKYGTARKSTRRRVKKR